MSADGCCTHEMIAVTLAGGAMAYLAPCRIQAVRPAAGNDAPTTVLMEGGDLIRVTEPPEVVLAQRHHVLRKAGLAELPGGWKFSDVVANSDIGPVVAEDGRHS